MLIKLRKMMTNQKGFTLIELLVVIAILGVLAAIAIPRFANSTARANTAKIAADLRIIDSALSMNEAAGAAATTAVGDLVTRGYLTATPTAPTGTYILGTGVVPSGGGAAAAPVPIAITAGTDYVITAATANAGARASFGGTSQTSDYFK